MGKTVPPTAAASKVTVTPVKSTNGPVHVTILPPLPAQLPRIAEPTKATVTVHSKSTQPEIHVHAPKVAHRHVATNPEFAKVVAKAEAERAAKKAAKHRKA